MFRFALRDMLWLTVVAAMSVAWWADHAALNRTRSALSEARKQADDLLLILKQDGYDIHAPMGNGEPFRASSTD